MFDFIEPSPTMKLDGGIETYVYMHELFETKRYKTDTPPLGRKVIYLNKNGYDIERETASRYFTEGQVLTVKEIYVGRNSSDVEFIELPNKKFNTVMFADLDEG